MAGFTAAGAAGFATFFAVLRTASFASCLTASSFASASTTSAVVPSRAMRWSLQRTARAVDRRHFPASQHAERVRVRPAHCGPNLGGGANRQRAHVLPLDRKRERPFLSEHRELLPGFLGAASANCWLMPRRPKWVRGRRCSQVHLPARSLSENRQITALW